MFNLVIVLDTSLRSLEASCYKVPYVMAISKNPHEIPVPVNIVFEPVKLFFNTCFYLGFVPFKVKHDLDNDSYYLISNLPQKVVQ